jgi:hypothetical protein
MYFHDSQTNLSFMQLIVNRSMAPALRELRRWVRRRVSEIRDVVGYDLAALRIISKAAQERKQKSTFVKGENLTDVWGGMGLGSDLAAALEGRNNRSKNKKR